MPSASMFPPELRGVKNEGPRGWRSWNCSWPFRDSFRRVILVSIPRTPSQSSAVRILARWAQPIEDAGMTRGVAGSNTNLTARCRLTTTNTSHVIIDVYTELPRIHDGANWTHPPLWIAPEGPASRVPSHDSRWCTCVVRQAKPTCHLYTGR